MGLKASRVCDICLIEEKTEFFINREDIMDTRKASDVGWIVNWLCDRCKRNKNLLREGVELNNELG